MSLAAGWLYPVAATVTAMAAVTTAGFAAATWRAVRRHDRALFGEEAIAEWDGLVTEVRQNRQALKEEDLR